MTQAPVSPAADPTRQRRPLSDQVVVRCSGVTKIFRDFWMRHRVRAVDNVDLDIRRGEVFGLLGPNGSGKSTTIKMILGLLHPTAGRISVFGKRPDDVATKRLIGYLPEESYLYRFLNARETLEYYSKLFHQSGAQSKRRIDMLLEMVGLESAQRRPVGEYSKGMQRRIGLAQALINDPQLLILDEPTTGLDPIGTKQIKDLIVELANRGKTILLCSHLLSDVEDVCDRVSIMFGGKVRAQGTCDELLVQQDATTIQTPALDDQTIAEIEQVLARRGLAIDRVDQPRQRLEQLFLDIVQRAQKEGAVTSGAKSGGKIADFLVAEDEGHRQTQAVVDSLLAKAPAEPADKSAADTPSPAVQADLAVQRQQRAVVDDLIAPAAKAAGAAAVTGAAGAPKTPNTGGSSGSGAVGASGASGGSGAGQPQADLGLINELVGQRTAGTPERVAPSSADSPTGTRSGVLNDPPVPGDGASAAKATPAKPAAAAPAGGTSGGVSGGTSGGGEEPDTSFLDALKQVPPYDESADDKGKGKTSGRDGE